MSDMTVLRHDGPWTLDDLVALPDDGMRYELVDGTLLVSAAPSKVHQRVLGNLHLLLRDACPPELEVFLAPTDYQPTTTRSLQPDLLVVRRDDPGDAAVTTPLALAVEVLSPSTRSIDVVLKRALYEQAGVEQYWVVDPLEPSVTIWSLRDGGYGDPLVVIDEAAVDGPVSVVLDPRDLLR